MEYPSARDQGVRESPNIYSFQGPAVILEGTFGLVAGWSFRTEGIHGKFGESCRLIPCAYELTKKAARTTTGYPNDA